MVFWTTYPFWKSIGNRDRFRSEIVTRDSIPSPTGKDAQKAEIETIPEIRTFLNIHFGDPPRTPILDLVIDPMDHVLFVRDDSNQIAGTIRYHFIGNLITSRSEPIYVVDAFCIHPSWRKRGVGDYLLTELNQYVNANEIPYSIFLKEGAPLSILRTPLYTGWYRYREIMEHRLSKYITDLTVQEAYRIMDIYRSIRPNLLIIRNENTKNQIWKLFRSEGSSILIGIQDTYQRIDHKKMGWITTWIESPLIDDRIREEAANAVADSLYPTFDFLWSNERWIGNSERWKRDGAFHWYTYQWSTAVPIDVSYSVMM
jgi:GNAT superfamily N-acetyltransferase